MDSACNFRSKPYITSKGLINMIHCNSHDNFITITDIQLDVCVLILKEGNYTYLFIRCNLCNEEMHVDFRQQEAR